MLFHPTSDQLLRENGISVTTLHDYRDVLFGGHAPEPEGKLLDDCRAKMKETGAIIGIRNEQEAMEMVSGMDWKLTEQEMQAVEDALAVWD